MGTEAQMTAGCPKGLFFMDRREPHCKGCTPSERRPGRQHIAELHTAGLRLRPRPATSQRSPPRTADSGNCRLLVPPSVKRQLP